MQSFSVQLSQDNIDAQLAGLTAKEADILLLFTTSDCLRGGELPAKIKALFPQASLLGCSTSGEIGAHVEDDSVTLMGLKFEKSSYRCAAVEIDGAEGSYTAGAEIARQLAGDKLAGVFVLMPGVNVNGSKFTKGLKDGLPAGVSVSGGLAGDGLNFQETFTVFNEDTKATQAVAFALYGDDVKVRSGSRGGWRPFGPRRRVTKATDNILYELDGKSALDLYKEYLGEKAADLPSSGLLYPFAIMDDDNSESTGLIRTILNIDEESKSLILAGDMEVGQMVCLMHAATDELVDGAEQAARDTNPQINGMAGDAVICVSCVGRKILMGDDTEDELDAVRDVFEDKPIVGFYSYGEICHFIESGVPELHNQTMTITYITENTA